MPKISVIIPIYNLAGYIERCIRSIQASIEQDYEVIIVDDGSTDESRKICKALAGEDNRIRVLHKVNGGVSSARNFGIDEAKGEWISFVDGDDEVSPYFLSISTDMEDCDVIQKRRVSDKGDTIFSIEDNIIIGKMNIYRYFIRYDCLEITNRLFKRDLIGQDRFATNIPIGEDGLFFFTILNKVRKWGFSSTGYYIYLIRSSSAMGSTATMRRIGIWFDLCDAAYKIALRKQNLMLYENYIADKYIPAIWARRTYLSTEQKKEFKKIMKLVSIKNLRLLNWKHIIKYLLIRVQYLVAKF